MNTIEKLASYRRALEKWKAQKDRHEIADKEGKKIAKALESEPNPLVYLISESEMIWANKIRAEIMAKVHPALQPKVKLPTRN